MVSITGIFSGPMYQRDVSLDGAGVIGWWERRRLFYNKILASVGTVTCILMISCGLISEPLIGELIGIRTLVSWYRWGSSSTALWRMSAAQDAG